MLYSDAISDKFCLRNYVRINSLKLHYLITHSLFIGTNISMGHDRTMTGDSVASVDQEVDLEAGIHNQYVVIKTSLILGQFYLHFNLSQHRYHSCNRKVRHSPFTDRRTQTESRIANRHDRAISS